MTRQRQTAGRVAALLCTLCMALAARQVPAVTWPWQPGQDVIGTLAEDRLSGDWTLVDMARMHNIGFNEIELANPGIDPWLANPGRRVAIPQLHVLPDGPREGIVVNLSERRLYYFAPHWPDRDGPVVSTHPVGVGLIDRQTPELITRVSARIDDPAWYPTPEVRAWYRREQGIELPAVIPPGPDNPLGEHALILDADGLMIHGTHRPAGVGMRVSQGCIRLYPEGIANLIGQVPVGTPVRIVNQPARLGWRGEALYLEVDSPDAGQADTIVHDASVWQTITSRLANLEEDQRVRIDHEAARAAFERADSVPTIIGRRAAH